VWQEARADEYASGLDGNTYEARMVFGIKIVYDHDTESITIWNTAKGGDFYKEVKELEPFLERGWRYGVYKTAMKNYLDKLDHVEASMKKEVNGKRNPKQIKSLKNARVRLLGKYNYISEKLNQIN
tara:strand:+ start:1563 stop:1940 length:378 start_codon:yes stop_codon:yes gene_type:complete